MLCCSPWSEIPSDGIALGIDQDPPDVNAVPPVRAEAVATVGVFEAEAPALGWRLTEWRFVGEEILINQADIQS